MAITINKMTDDVSNISKLEDRPNLSADELKTTFDKAPEDIKAYINEILINGIETGFDTVKTEMNTSVSSQISALTAKVNALYNSISVGSNKHVTGAVRISSNAVLLWGYVNFPASGSNVQSIDVTFPVTFTAMPRTVATPDSTVPQNVKVSFTDFGNSTGYKKVRINMQRNSKTATQVHFQTVGRCPV